MTVVTSVCLPGWSQSVLEEVLFLQQIAQIFQGPVSRTERNSVVMQSLVVFHVLWSHVGVAILRQVLAAGTAILIRRQTVQDTLLL